MHIEINAGGLGTGCAVLDYQNDLSRFIAGTKDVIGSFKTIKSETNRLNGGIGGLIGAMDELDRRISAEEAKKEEAVSVQNRSNDYLALAARVDGQVAGLVNKNKDEFYRVNPGLKPPTEESKEKKAWYEKTWDWLCDTGDAIGEGFEAAWDWTCDTVGKAWDWTCDTAKKAWDSAVDFYQEHKNLCHIVIGVFAIAVAVVVTVATGGAAVPALLAMTKAAISAGLVSAAIKGSFTTISSLAGGNSLEDSLSQAFDSAVDGFCSGFMWGGVFAAGSQIVSSTLLPKAPDNLDTAREVGVKKAKANELEAIKNNTSQYDWSPKQKADFLRTGKFEGIDGCHILDASRYPKFANDPQNIILLPRWTQHFEIVHGGNWANPSDWSAILETMPHFSQQIGHMKFLGTISDLFSSQVIPVVAGSGIGVATS